MSLRTVVILLLIQGWLIGSAGMTAVPTHSVSSQELSWSDDFQDGNYNDWGTYGVDNFVKYPGNITVRDGALYAQYPDWNIIYHESEVAFGTWSFDVYAVDREEHEILIGFMTGNHTASDWWKNTYAVQLITGPYHAYTEDTITLVRLVT